MTRIETLQSGIENLQSQLQTIRSQRWEAEQAFNEKLTAEMSRFFRGVVCEDVLVTANSHSINFSMRDDKCHLKEIFQIYLKENYSIQREFPYKGIELSYYTTGTNSDFELERLQNLGRVALTIKHYSNEILDKVNTLAIEFTNEMTERGFYKQISELEKQVSEVRSQITEIEKEENKTKLFSEEGLSFDRATRIRMKSNYSPTIKNLKLVEVKGTRAKAIFTFAQGGSTSYEENVNVEKILEQVL